MNLMMSDMNIIEFMAIPYYNIIGIRIQQLYEKYYYPNKILFEDKIICRWSDLEIKDEADRLEKFLNDAFNSIK